MIIDLLDQTVCYGETTLSELSLIMKKPGARINDIMTYPIDFRPLLHEVINGQVYDIKTGVKI